MKNKLSETGEFIRLPPRKIETVAVTDYGELAEILECWINENNYNCCGHITHDTIACEVNNLAIGETSFWPCWRSSEFPLCYTPDGKPVCGSPLRDTDIVAYACYVNRFPLDDTDWRRERDPTIHEIMLRYQKAHPHPDYTEHT